MSNISQSKTIAINSILLYARMLFIMLITLYSVRLVLAVLGQEDYGIYNVVAGIVSSMTFMTSVMTSATLRFFSYSLGKKDYAGLNKIFSISINIYFFLVVIILVLCETIGLWFVNNELVFPDGKLFIVNCVYQLAIFSFIISIIAIPYSSLLLAHENMKLYSIITIIDAVLKCLIIFFIKELAFDKLIAYSLLLFGVHTITTMLYFFVCRMRYIECRYKFCKDSKSYVELLSYSGWTLFGTLAGVANNQGNTIIINLFFGPIVNASRAIAMQVNVALSTFSNNFIMALRPALIKSYAEGNYRYMLKLYHFSNRFIYYLMLIMCLPLFLEMSFVLNLWLIEVDSNMVIFSKLTLVYVIILSLNSPITIIVQATGKVKRYFLLVESFTLLSMPLTYLFYKFGGAAETTYYVMILVFTVAHLIRLLVLQNLFPIFTISDYFTKFVLRALVITIVVVLSVYYIQNWFSEGFFRLFIVFFSSTVLMLLGIIAIGLNKDEKTYVLSFIMRKNK